LSRQDRRQQPESYQAEQEGQSPLRGAAPLRLILSAHRRQIEFSLVGSESSQN
jgi:hypothetical protein